MSNLYTPDTHAGDTQLHIELPSGEREKIRPGRWVAVGSDGLLRAIPTPSENTDGR